MLFNSLDFIIFFPIVLLGYFFIPEKIKYIWLLLVSYYFYMCWNAKYVVLILLSTVFTYISGLLLEKIHIQVVEEKRSVKLKKCVVAGSLIINLGILFFFKYTNFAFDCVAKTLSILNVQVSAPKIDIILPVGISFYTFQALSYTMDVYREEIYAERNFFKYALFVSFFPQLVAGPIERSKNLLKQLAVPRKLNSGNIIEGIFIMLWGYFLKIVIADRIAIFVDTVYENYTICTGYSLVVATIFFAIQIYCDFAGYSTIAIGTARVLGINLMENFDAPYLSTSVSEFWRRWHISLTSWFKDYLYIPLGGSRKGKVRKYINKLIVFLVSGLWHGADLSYVVWGGINGIYQIFGEMLMPVRDRLVCILRLNRESFGHKMVQCVATFCMVCFSWIFFRASSMRVAIEIIKRMFAENNPWIFFDGTLYYGGLDERNFWFAIFCILILFTVDCFRRRGIRFVKIIMKQDGWFKCLVIVFSVVFILIFGKYGPTYDSSQFIYFQF